MSLALERKLPLILLLAFLMLAAIGFFSYRSTQSLKDAVAWQAHTQDVLIKLDETLISALDVETGGRGFALTGDENFLEPYQKSRQTAITNLDSLKQLIADNPKQVENFSALAINVNDRITASEDFIEIRRTDGLLGAANAISKGKGKMIMDNIRLNIEQMKSEELRLLKLRQSNLQTTLNNNFWMITVSTIVGTGLLAFANFVVLYEIKKRRVAESGLVEANQGLEKRVEQRTAEKEILLQNEQAARREAEIATRLRDEFMATISHELRTPLNAILGWARIVKTGKVTQEMESKAIDTIIKNAETQNRLIEDLMDVSRVISGKLVLEFETVNPAELVTNSVETVQPSAADKAIFLTLNIDENGKEKTISGDPNRLRQVILNLLTNAIKFTPEGGKIDVGLAAENEWIVVKVKDNGAGINSDFLPFVFERFRQDAANIKKSGGLGLGLAIVRHLTELHGGTVSVESEGENKGATFTVNFPIS
jgi:signal transduction histidine kinase